jgi:hypothetical protein
MRAFKPRRDSDEGCRTNVSLTVTRNDKKIFPLPPTEIERSGTGTSVD